MINNQQYFQQHNLLLGETIKVESWFYAPFTGEIRAKIKGINAYVVSIPSVANYVLGKLLEIYGFPNRYLELEWGGWTGRDNEFVIGIDKLTR